MRILVETNLTLAERDTSFRRTKSSRKPHKISIYTTSTAQKVHRGPVARRLHPIPRSVEGLKPGLA